MIEWNNLKPRLIRSESFSAFKANIPKFIHSTANSVYTCHNSREMCHIIRHRITLSHLREHKLNYISKIQEIYYVAVEMM